MNISSASLRKYTSFLAALYPITCLIYGYGYEAAPYISLISSFFILFITRKIPIGLKNNLIIKNIILILIFYYLMMLLIKVHINHDPFSHVRHARRFVIIIPILLLFIKYPINRLSFLYATSVGGIISGLSAIYYKHNYPFERAFSEINGDKWTSGFHYIQTGDMSMAFGLLSLTVFFYAYIKRNYPLLGISLIGCLMGIFGSFLSESRGGWIAIPVAIVYLIWSNRHKIKAKYLALFTITAVGLILASSQLNVINHRIEQAINDTNQYVSNTTHNTSLGMRYGLWKSAILVFKESPIVGMNQEKIYQFKRELADKNIIDKATGHFDYHAHNEFLQALSNQGIIGLIALLLLMGYPLYQFEKLRRQTSNKDNNQLELGAMSQLGSLLILTWIIFSLSQCLLSHYNGDVFYSMMLAILIGSCFSPNYKEKSD